MKVYTLKVLSDIGCVGQELELRGQEGKGAPLTRTTNCGGCKGRKPQFVLYSHQLVNDTTHRCCTSRRLSG